MSDHFSKLDALQLQGADYALRLLLTSPVLRGEARKLTESLVHDCREQMKMRLCHHLERGDCVGCSDHETCKAEGKDCPPI